MRLAVIALACLAAGAVLGGAVAAYLITKDMWRY